MLTYFIIIKMILSLTPSCATNNVITIIFFNFLPMSFGSLYFFFITSFGTFRMTTVSKFSNSIFSLKWSHYF